MKEIKKYVAEDGKVFDSPAACAQYEKEKEDEKNARLKKMSDDFLASVGFDKSKYKSIPEFNNAINRTWIVFDAYGKFQCLKTCGYGSLVRNDVELDFKYVSGDDKKDETIMENWLRKNKFYAHLLCSFVERKNEDFYTNDLAWKLKHLEWEFKNGKIAKCKW